MQGRRIFVISEAGLTTAPQGIKFEEYDFPGLKTENGIARHGAEETAWFKDPDGNILAVGTR